MRPDTNRNFQLGQRVDCELCRFGATELLTVMVEEHAGGMASGFSVSCAGKLAQRASRSGLGIGFGSFACCDKGQESSLQQSYPSSLHSRRFPPAIADSPVSALESMDAQPRNFNQGPAIEIWSVVHFPLALINSLRPFKSVPSHSAKGANSCNLLELGSTKTCLPLPSAAGASKPASSTAKPLIGNSSPVGASI